MSRAKNKLKYWLLNIIILNFCHQNESHSAMAWYNDQHSNRIDVLNNAQGSKEANTWNNGQGSNSNKVWKSGQSSNNITMWNDNQGRVGPTIWNNVQGSKYTIIKNNGQGSNGNKVWNNDQGRNGTTIWHNDPGSNVNKIWKKSQGKNDIAIWNFSQSSNGITILNNVQERNGSTIQNNGPNIKGNKVVKNVKDKNDRNIRNNGTKEQQLSVILPVCTNITVTFSDYVQSSDNGRLRLNIGYDTGDWVTQWTLSLDNNTVSLCYPLSPQLLQCNTQRLTSQDYRIQNYSLYLKDGPFLAGLGDYYVDDLATAYACDEPIKFDATTTRCHYVTLASNNYETKHNGDLYIKTARLLVHRPRFATRINHSSEAKVCYPLSVALLNCDARHKTMVPSYRYSLRRDLAVYYLSDDLLFGLGDYRYVSGDGDVEVCMRPSIYYRILVISSYVSNLCLVLSFMCQLLEGKPMSHRKCLICHNGCLVVSCIWSTYQRRSNYWTPSCAAKYASFVIGYLGVVATVVWLVIAGYDVSRSFADLSSGGVLCRNGQDTRRFLLYSIIGWGTPAAFMAVVLTINFSPFLQTFLRLNPQLGTIGWFHDRQTSYVFYHIPLLMLSCLNLVFFFKAIYHIRKAGNGTELVNNQRNKQLLSICNSN